MEIHKQLSVAKIIHCFPKTHSKALLLKITPTISLNMERSSWCLQEPSPPMHSSGLSLLLLFVLVVEGTLQARKRET